MDVKDLARRLKMNERTVYKLIQEGQIPALKSGKKWEIDKEKITKWIGLKIPEFKNIDLAYLERDHREAIIKIHPLLKPDNVILDFYASSKSHAIKKITETAAGNNRLTPDQREKLLQAVIDRERLCSTAIGEGVAIPHPRDVVVTGRRKVLFAAGVCRNGMDFESLDGRPTHLIFLLSAPRSDIHLKIMARLSRLLRDKVLRYRLTKAGGFKEFKDIIKAGESLMDKEVEK